MGRTTQRQCSAQTDSVVMASIRVTCETCGDIDLDANGVIARCCVDDDRNQYRFRCPTCDFVTVKSTQLRVIKLLEANGVPVEYWELPQELHERRSGATLTHDDVISFHTAMRDDDELGEALAELIEELSH